MLGLKPHLCVPLGSQVFVAALELDYARGRPPRVNTVRNLWPGLLASGVVCRAPGIVGEVLFAALKMIGSVPITLLTQAGN